jgi:hypothetical protein
LVQIDNKLFAVLSNGKLWIKPLNQAKWQHMLTEIGRIKTMAAGS